MWIVTEFQRTCIREDWSGDGLKGGGHLIGSADERNNANTWYILIVR